MKKSVLLVILALFLYFNRSWRFLDDQSDYYKAHGIPLPNDWVNWLPIIVILIISAVFYLARVGVKSSNHNKKEWHDKNCEVKNLPVDHHSGVRR